VISKFNSPVFINLPKYMPPTKEANKSTALSVYKHYNQTGGDENIAQIKLVNEASPYEEINVCPNNYHAVIGKKLKDFAMENHPDGDKEIQNDKELRESGKNIRPVCLIEEDLNINFYLNGDDESGENGNGDEFPPQPPGGFGILLRSCSDKANHDPIKKHIYIIFIANLGLNTVKQPFFKKLINALYVNIFFMDNDHKLLSTLSFDSLYEYYLAYQGNGIGRLIYNISGIDAFLNVNNDDEERKNEDGVGANSNSINKTITHISNYDITFIQDLNEEEKNADTSYYSYISSICSNIRNKTSDWVKGKEENVESELEVPLLDKSGENDEIKYSDGNNSSGSIAENIISWFAPKSDKSKNLNMSVALKEADLEIKGSTPTENITAKLDLSNVPEYSSSGVSTAASTPRNRGVKIEERGAPKKEGNSSYDNNILHVSKFKKLDLEKNKTFMISFTNNGECEVTTYNGRWVQEKNLNPQQGYYPCSIKKPEGYNEAHDQWLQDNNDINLYGEEISGNSMQSVEN